MIFKRFLRLANLLGSAFLFGPRMTGKTFLLRELPSDLYIDLLDPELELQFKQTPRLFWEQISALKSRAVVVVDEVQRVPALLDYVQKGIEEKQLRFCSFRFQRPQTETRRRKSSGGAREGSEASSVDL